MKEKFIEYHIEEYIDELLEDAIIVLDTNAMLNLYRYNNDNRKKYLGILNDLNGRLHSTYNIISEFYRNRYSLVRNRSNFKPALLKFFNEYLEKLKDTMESGTGKSEYAAALAILRNEDDLRNSIQEHIDIIIENISSEIEKFNDEINSSYVNKDEILDEICYLFKDKITEEFTEEKLEEIYKKGEVRFDKSIPPGFKDNKKSHPDKYGDLIIWYELMELAKAEQKHILFVSDDRKEDWVLKIEGKDYGTRKDLIKEFYSETSQLFYSMRTGMFIEKISKIINIPDIKELESETDKIAKDIDYSNNFVYLDSKINIKNPIEIYKKSAYFENLDKNELISLLDKYKTPSEQLKNSLLKYKEISDVINNSELAPVLDKYINSNDILERNNFSFKEYINTLNRLKNLYNDINDNNKNLDINNNKLNGPNNEDN